MDMPAAARAKKPRASTARVDAPFCARGHGHRCVPDSHGVSCVRDDRLGSGFPLGVLLGSIVLVAVPMLMIVWPL